jgi:hypothetical protein
MSRTLSRCAGEGTAMYVGAKAIGCARRIKFLEPLALIPISGNRSRSCAGSLDVGHRGSDCCRVRAHLTICLYSHQTESPASMPREHQEGNSAGRGLTSSLGMGFIARIRLAAISSGSGTGWKAKPTGDLCVFASLRFPCRCPGPVPLDGRVIPRWTPARRSLGEGGWGPSPELHAVHLSGGGPISRRPAGRRCTFSLGMG